MYTFDSRIRYSEVGSDTRLCLISLLDYFQDCSTFQSEDLGLGIDYLKEHHMVWLMSSWQIDVLRYASLGERVTVGTVPYEIKGCFGHRNFYMAGQDTEMLAKANTLWTLVDTRTMSPTKPTQKMLDSYTIEPKLEMEYLPRKLKFTGEALRYEAVEVKKHHLDSNFHVNNGQYVAIACDYLPENFAVRRMRASYHKSAVLNDAMFPSVYHMADDTIGVSLCSEDGDIYANVMFSSGAF